MNTRANIIRIVLKALCLCFFVAGLAGVIWGFLPCLSHTQKTDIKAGSVEILINGEARQLVIPGGSIDLTYPLTMLPGWVQDISTEIALNDRIQLLASDGSDTTEDTLIYLETKLNLIGAILDPGAQQRQPLQDRTDISYHWDTKYETAVSRNQARLWLRVIVVDKATNQIAETWNLLYREFPMGCNSPAGLNAAQLLGFGLLSILISIVLVMIQRKSKIKTNHP